MTAGRVQVLDILFAFKAIALSDHLTGNQKRVAATLIDHFNRKTGQCDPALDTIANLLDISRRTVIRTMIRLEKIGLFRRVRHGGHFHRNSYEPVWIRFRELDDDWKKHRARRRALWGGQLSPFQCQIRHIVDATPGTQTYPINQSPETCSKSRDEDNAVVQSMSTENKRLSKRKNDKTLESVNSPLHVKRTSSRDAAHDSAERRWNIDLNNQFSNDPLLYARILEAIDSELQREATLAEFARPGSGLRFILDRLEILKLTKGSA